MTTAVYSMRRNQNLIKSRDEVKLGPVSMSVLLVAAMVVLALLYLNQVTKTSVFGYKVTALEQKKSELVGQRKELEVEAARLSSIEQIKNSRVAGAMVAQQNVSYSETRVR